MKRALFLGVVNLGFLGLTWLLLNWGEAAQRTHTYSVLRELELTGAITNADQLTTVPPGNKLLSMNPVKEFHIAVLAGCFAWAAVVTVFFMATESRPCDQRKPK